MRVFTEGRHHAPDGSENDQDGNWAGSIYQDRIWAMLDEHGIEPDGAHYRYHEARHSFHGPHGAECVICSTKQPESV